MNILSPFYVFYVTLTAPFQIGARGIFNDVFHFWDALFSTFGVLNGIFGIWDVVFGIWDVVFASHSFYILDGVDFMFDDYGCVAYMQNWQTRVLAV